MATEKHAASALLRDPPTEGQDDYLFQLASAHEEAGELDLARDVAVKALQPQAFPDHLPTLLLAGRVLARKKDGTREGVSLSSRGVEQAEAQKCGPEVLSEAHHIHGVNLLLRAREALTEEERDVFLKRAEAALVAAASYDQCSAAALTDLGLTLAERGAYEEALATAKRALKRDGGSSAATWHLLSLLLSTQRRHEEAVEICRLGIRTVAWPGNAKLHELLGAIQRSVGNLSDAVATFKALLMLDQEPNKEKVFPNGWLLLASVYIEGKKFDDAVACLNKAKAAESLSAYWSTLGHLHEARGETTYAVKAYDRAVQINGEDSSLRVKLASALLDIDSSHVEQARAHLQAALRTNPRDPDALFNMGLVYQEAGDLENASRSFHRARLLGDSYPPVPFSTVPISL